MYLRDHEIDKITPELMENYAIKTGWEHAAYYRHGKNHPPTARIYEKVIEDGKPNQWEQLTIPLSSTLDDYKKRVNEFFVTLAEMEQREILDIINEFIDTK